MELFENQKVERFSKKPEEIKTARTSVQDYLAKNQVLTMGRERTSEGKAKKFISTLLLLATLATPARVQQSNPPLKETKIQTQMVKKPEVNQTESISIIKQVKPPIVDLKHPQVVASIETGNELRHPAVEVKIKPGLEEMQHKINERILERNFLAYRSIVRKLAHEYNIPPLLIHAIIQTESSYNPKAESSASAFGLMGLQTQTIKGMINEGLIESLPVREYETNPILNMKAGLTYINWIKKNLYKNTPQIAKEMKERRAFFNRQPEWWQLKEALKAYNVGINNYYKKGYDPSKNTYYVLTIKNMKRISSVIKKLEIQKYRVEMTRK